MALKIALINLGCARNLVDSETLLFHLKQAGFNIVEDMEQAQVGIINTCAFINDAKKESIDIILDAVYLKEQKKLKYIVVTGCLAQRYSEDLYNEITEIDAIVSPCYYDKIVFVLNEILKGNRVYKVGKPGISNSFFGKREPITPKSYTYLKISEGCDNFCTFCVIPSIRGKYNSRDIDSLLYELESIYEVMPQLKEVNLVAQDTTFYGYKNKDSSFIRLLRKICNYDFLKWVRILYSHPKHFTEDLINEISNNPKLCRYIDLPLQHINDKILKKMNRGMNKSDIIRLIYKIRERIPNVTIRTSFIVGFPGETEEDFDELVKFVEEFEFEKVGLFIYSKEEGTPAYSYPDQVGDKEKMRRFNELMDVQKHISESKLVKFLGKELNILIDKVTDIENVYLGRTEFDAPEVDGQVFIKSVHKCQAGDFKKIKIIDTMEYDLVGEITEGR